jgi:hypothetical protein
VLLVVASNMSIGAGHTLHGFDLYLSLSCSAALPICYSLKLVCDGHGH